jgi:DNA-binding beta-propeller fold protein YncE
MMQHLARVALAASAAISIAVGAHAAAPAYTITKTIALGAPDRWDYLTFDRDSGRLYISHGDRVTVVDGKTGALLGNVEGFPGGTHGIAIAGGRGYTDDGKAGIAASFDLKTLKVVTRIKAEPDADGIVADKASNHIFIVDGDSGKLTVIDPMTDTAVATVDVSGGLEFAVSGNNGKVYVNGADNKEIVRVDVSTNKVDARWPIPTCTSPHGLAIDTASRRLFASCENNVLLAIDADSGKVVATLPIGTGTDADAFDSRRKLVFSSNRDGTLSVIAEKSADEFAPQPSIQTALGARTMALDPDSGRIYLVTADFTVNPKADPSDERHRYTITPGSAKLLFLDPSP